MPCSVSDDDDDDSLFVGIGDLDQSLADADLGKNIVYYNDPKKVIIYLPVTETDFDVMHFCAAGRATLALGFGAAKKPNLF
jgi:hypothetical protein